MRKREARNHQSGMDSVACITKERRAEEPKEPKEPGLPFVMSFPHNEPQMGTVKAVAMLS